MDYLGQATTGGVITQEEFDDLEDERIASTLHRMDDSIHREMDDALTTFSSLWSSSKTAAEIASGSGSSPDFTAPLLTCAFGNAADNLNSGLLQEYDKGAGTRYSGLTRSRDDDRQYLLKDAVSVTSGNNITSLDVNSLVINQLDLNQNADASTSIIKFNNDNAQFRWAGDDGVTDFRQQYTAVQRKLFTIADATVVRTIDIGTGDYNINPTTSLTIGTGATNYTLPITRGTVGQVLETDGSGVVTWETNIASGGGTLQEAYDASTDPQITSTLADQTLVLRQGAGLSDELLQIQNTTGATRMVLSADGNMAISGSNSAIKLQTSAGGDGWTIRNDGGLDTLKIVTANFGDAISITQGGLISFNNSLNEFRFPSGRGSDGQVLTAQLGGASIGWETPSSGSSTLQEAYDLSTSPQILTDVTNTELVVKSHTTNASAFSVLDSTNGSVFNVNASGTCSTSILEADRVAVLDVQLKNNLNVNRFSIEHEQATDSISTKNASGNEVVRTNQDGSTTWLVNGNDSVILSDDGNIGLGFDPGSHVFATFKQSFPALMSATTASNSASHRSMMYMKRSRGTIATPSAISSGDWISNVITQGHDGAGWGTCADILVLASETWSAGNHGCDMRFTTTANGDDTITERMRITSEGLICIGNPSGGSVYYMPPSAGTTGQTMRLDGSDQLVFESIIPTTSVDNTITRFNGVTGSLQDSGWTIDDSDNLSDGTSSFTGATGLSTPECHVDNIYLRDGIGGDQWSISEEGSNTLNIRNALSVDTLVVGQDGTTQFRIAGVNTAVVNVTGLHMQGNPIDEVSTLEVSTDVLYPVPHFDGYFYGNAAQTILTQGTYEQADFGNTFVTGTNLTDFTVANSGVVTYSGSRDRKCEVTFSFSIGTDIAQSTLHLELFVAVNVPVDLSLDNANGSQQKLFMSGNDLEIHTGSIHFYPTLSNGDTLRLYVRSSTDPNAQIEWETGNFIGTCISNVI